MSEKQKYYITTAIAYTSGKPHIGNTYEIVLADAVARYKRNFYSDLFIFDNISGGVVCIWENRDSGSRLYVCMYGMSFRRGCSDTGVSDRVFWILSTTVVF